MGKAEKIIQESNNLRVQAHCFYPLVIKDAEGCYLIDVDGKRYLDFNCNISSQNIGYGHPEIKEIIRKYSERGIYKIAGADFYSEEALELAKKALSIVPKVLTKVFFINTGAEAVENCIKMAYRKIGPLPGVSCKGAFHGRTLGALSYTHSKPVQKKNFPEITHHLIKFCRDDNDEQINELEEIVKGEKISFVIVEPVQGESGYIPASKKFLQTLRNITKENNIPLILDEVQSGMGRTGKWWAHEHYGIEPDLMAASKSFNVGASFTSDEYDIKECGAISSTWGGGHLIDMAVSRKVIEIIERDKLMGNATKIGNHIMKRLKEMEEKYSKMNDVRGIGLMIGFDFGEKGENKKIVLEGLKNGLSLLPCGLKSIRIAPPLIITEELANKGLDILEDVIKKLS